MKHTTKRLLAVVLALVLCLSLLPSIAMAADTYVKVTSMAEITSGGKFVIVAGNYALGTTIGSKISGVNVTPSGNSLTGNNLPVWTVRGASGGIALSADGQYLAYDEANTNSKTDFLAADAAYTWTVTAGENGYAVMSKNVPSRGIFLQNSKSRFGVYSTANTSGYVTELQLYKLSDGESGDTDPIEPSEPESGMTPAEIVDAAYALEVGTSMTEAMTLKGEIVSIDTPYNSQYSNITVTIAIEGKEDKPIQCYRLKGTGADALAIGDVITVTGILKNYNGTIEFDAGCTLDAVEKGDGPVIEAPEDPKEIVDAAYALEPGKMLPYEATLTGKVTEIVEAYSEQYSNITVNMVITGREDKPIMCYRMKGEGADTLAVGDIITVTGNLKNYTKTDSGTGITTNTIEFTPCTFVKGGGTPAMTPAEILAAAYALAEGESLEGTQTLTGKIIAIKDPYDPTYSNISVIIEIPGHADKPILCYRVAGEGAEGLLVDDTITVTGTLTNYKGTIEFAQGCTLDNVISGGGTAPVAPEDPKQIVEEAYALAEGTALPYKATLTGVITEIVKYDETYGDLTVVIVVEGKDFECYAMKGENLLDLEVGDTITVTGTIKNYYGKIEFDKPSLDAVGAPVVGVTVSGAVTTGAVGDTTVELLSGEEVVATATVSGKEGIFELVNVAVGTYTLKVSKLNHVAREYTVNVDADVLNLDVKIHLIGDIDGNGLVNMGDISNLYAHIKGTKKLTDEYQLLVANINGGSLNLGDFSTLYAHINGTKKLY